MLSFMILCLSWREIWGQSSMKNTWESLRMGKWKDRELMFGQTARYTKANGRITWWMIKEDNSIGLMVRITREDILMTKNMGKVLWYGINLRDIEVTGLLAIAMATVNRSNFVKKMREMKMVNKKESTWKWK